MTRRCIPLEAAAKPASPPEEDLARAEAFGPLRLGRDYLFHQGLFHNAYLPLGEIARCYKRLEDSSSTVCCGRTTFTDCYLVLESKSGLQRKYPLERQATLDSFLRALAERRPDIPIGYHEQERNPS